MSDAATQVVRSVMQAFWSAVLGLTVVDSFLVETGLDPEWAKGAAVTISMAVVIWLARNAPKLHPLLGNLISGINKDPGYTSPAEGGN